MCSGNCGRSCTVCKICGGIVTLVLLLATIAAFLGVWVTHSTPAGWVFGTTAGSLALGVLILSIVALHKTFHKMCGCGSKGGCGAGCDCGKDGMMGPKCPMCGKMPCQCK
jgi:hypothetical protein